MTFCFNTQPPEGGWVNIETSLCWFRCCFNTQPPEGGWLIGIVSKNDKDNGFNTQPPEGGWLRRRAAFITAILFQHTAARRRLEAASEQKHTLLKFQHTAARRRLELENTESNRIFLFQHTAARRRLVQTVRYSLFRVSTHSRPKAAGC